MNTPIYNQLLLLEKEKKLPFHMPGHKRKGKGIFKEIAKIDITEITDYDNLHHPEGIIRQSMDELKKIYGTKESWYLINGSTVGILASISACCKQGDGILIGRNCHKSVYNAIRLLHLQAYYFYPYISEEYGCVSAIGEEQIKEIKKSLKIHHNIKAVVLTSPTYEGVVMDIRRLKALLEPEQIPLIVDEAHGAHFLFHEYFPESAIKCGADIVIQSVHKTLPAMTQTALLHLCTDQIAPEHIADQLSIYETSSPSYVFMASAECAVAYMKESVERIQEYVDNLQNFRKQCGQLKHIHLIQEEDLECKDYDKSKLVFHIDYRENWNGITLLERLSVKYHIELEMADRMHCIAMTSVCDDPAMYHALWEALLEIDHDISQNQKQWDSLEHKKQSHPMTGNRYMGKQEKILESWQCSLQKKEEISLEEAEGRIAANYVMLYPPGSPILVPGEKIEKETVENMRYYIYNGYNVLGLAGERVVVLKEK